VRFLQFTVALGLGLLAGPLVMPAGPAGAQVIAEDTALESLDTWGASRGWEAVGLLEIGRTGRCTGTLVAADLVLTAAHCLYDRDSGVRVDPRAIEFRAGWRDGRSVAVRRVTSAVIDRSYDFAGDLDPVERIRHDVALLRLSDPIPYTHADPFFADSPVRHDEDVSVVSYGQGRYDAPSAQRRCHVEAQDGAVKAFTCEAVPGSSGSPVFVLRERRPRIVAVVSAVGPLEGRQVSFGMDVDAKLRDLTRAMRDGDGVFPPQASEARRVRVGGGGAFGAGGNAGAAGGGGAKFVRP